MSDRPQATAHPQSRHNPSTFNVLHQARAALDQFAGPGCQDCSTPPIEPPQHGLERKILTGDHYSVAILDALTEHAASFVDALLPAEITVTVFQTKQGFLEFVKEQQVDLGILVLHSKAWWKDELRLFCNSIRYLQENPEPEILCILNWPAKDSEEEAMDRISGDALRTDVRHEW